MIWTFALPDKSDPYVVFSVPGQKDQRSLAVAGKHNPKWNQKFKLKIENLYADVILRLFDKDDVSDDDPMGVCVIKPAEVDFNK